MTPLQEQAEAVCQECIAKLRKLAMTANPAEIDGPLLTVLANAYEEALDSLHNPSKWMDMEDMDEPEGM